MKKKKEEPRMEIFKNTDIISVEITGNKVAVAFATIENEAITNHKMEYDLKSRPIHPDFKKVMETMKLYLASVFYIADREDHFAVNKLEFDYKDNVDSVRISGKLLLASDNLTPVKTDFIRMSKMDTKIYEDFKNEEIEVDANLVRVEDFKY